MGTTQPHSSLHVHSFIPLSSWPLLMYLFIRHNEEECEDRQRGGQKEARRVQVWHRLQDGTDSKRVPASLAKAGVQWGHCQMLPGECAKEEETKQVGLSFGTVLASPSKVCPTFVLPSIHLPANPSFFTSLLLNSDSPFLCASSKFSKDSHKPAGSLAAVPPLHQSTLLLFQMISSIAGGHTVSSLKALITSVD